MRCPDDGREIEAGTPCRACRGFVLDAADVGARWPTVKLSLETRTGSAAFARTRTCPACDAVMAPLRIGDHEAWLERCGGCDLLWLDPLDVATMDRVARRGRLESAVAGMAPEQRRQMASDIAREVPTVERRLGPVRSALAVVGLPVLEGIDGDRTPVATWASAALLFAAFLLIPLSRLVYVTGTSGPLSALTAVFAHFGWLHLLGNLYFLVVFGDGVEQRLPRPLFVVLLFGVGAASLLAQAAVAPAGVAIGGASGGIEAIVGACIVLQPRARVVTRVIVPVLRLPILAFGAIELAFQVGMRLVGAPGVAWTAHLVGLGAGVALALVWKRLVGAPRPTTA